MKQFVQALRRTLGQAVGAVIPPHFKRILFLMTLYHYMRGSNEVQLSELEELDQCLSLAGTDSTALVIPGRLTSLIWGGMEQQSGAPMELTALQLLRNSPCWLLYGRREDIEKDVVKLRAFVNAHTHANA